MAKITSPMDAEARARQLIEDRNPSVRQILFKRTSKEGGFWLLEGEAPLKRLRLFKVRKSFRLKIRVEDGYRIDWRSIGRSRDEQVFAVMQFSDERRNGSKKS